MQPPGYIPVTLKPPVSVPDPASKGPEQRTFWLAAWRRSIPSSLGIFKPTRNNQVRDSPKPLAGGDQTAEREDRALQRRDPQHLSHSSPRQN